MIIADTPAPPLPPGPPPEPPGPPGPPPGPPKVAGAAVSVAVESSAAAMVELSLEDAPENAAFAQTSDLTGELLFCPSDAQIAAETIYPLLLVAEAGTQIVRKSYVIVLRRRS